MRIKDQILALFESHKGVYLSGEEIANELSVSRAAVWKAVKSLRSEGYEIHAVPNKGYQLSVSTDILSAQGIEKYLLPVCSNLELQILPTAASTNALLREKANEGAKEGYVIIANAQSNGRGRFGRSFYSPEDTGIYMSLLLRPQNTATDQAVSFTTMAAVSACEAIETVSGKQPGIKWVNDIYLNGKKVSGILTEASISMENGVIDFIVLGIGFNVYEPQNGFPEEIQQIAGAIFDEKRNDGKNALAAAFLNSFMSAYASWENMDYVEKYRARSIVKGKKITVLSSGGAKEALAVDVDSECHLIVQYEDGEIESLSSGEISIHWDREKG